MANPDEAKVVLLINEGATSLSAEILLRTVFDVVAQVENTDEGTIVSARFRVDNGMSIEQVIHEIKRRIGSSAAEYAQVIVTLLFPNFNPSQSYTL